MKEWLFAIMHMDIEVRCFLFSIVFQVCGALILLFRSFTNSKKQVPSAYFEQSNAGKIEDDQIVTLDKGVVAKILANIYHSRWSFGYLVIGYVLAIWSDIGEYPRERMIWYVLFLSSLIIVITFFIDFILSHIFASFRKNVKWKDIEHGTSVNVKYGEKKDKDGNTIVFVKKIIKE